MTNQIFSKNPYEKKHSRELIDAVKEGDVLSILEYLSYNKYLVYDFDSVSFSRRN